MAPIVVTLPFTWFRTVGRFAAASDQNGVQFSRLRVEKSIIALNLLIFKQN
jgi:hypothetical protein